MGLTTSSCKDKSNQNSVFSSTKPLPSQQLILQHPCTHTALRGSIRTWSTPRPQLSPSSFTASATSRGALGSSYCCYEQGSTGELLLLLQCYQQRFGGLHQNREHPEVTSSPLLSLLAHGAPAVTTTTVVTLNNVPVEPVESTF